MLLYSPSILPPENSNTPSTNGLLNSSLLLWIAIIVLLVLIIILFVMVLKRPTF